MFPEKVTGWGFSGGRSFWLCAPEHARLMAATWGQIEKLAKNLDIIIKKKKKNSQKTKTNKKGENIQKRYLVSLIWQIFAMRHSLLFLEMTFPYKQPAAEEITQSPYSLSDSFSPFVIMRKTVRIHYIHRVCAHSAARCKLFYGHLNWLFRFPLSLSFSSA